MGLHADQPASSHEESTGTSEHFSTSKFKKVFLKKRSDTNPEGHGSSSSSKSEDSSSHNLKKFAYSVKLQKLRRKVRKTYPLLETQENTLKTTESKQSYAPTSSLNESTNRDQADEPDRLSEIFETGRSHAQPVAVESSEDESQNLLDDEDGCSVLYEGTTSQPIGESVEQNLYDFAQSEPMKSNCEDTKLSLAESSIKPIEENQRQSYVNIDMSELFERPNLEGMDLQRNHLAPCLSPSESDPDKMKKNSPPNITEGENCSRPLDSNNETKYEANMRVKASSFHYCDTYFPTLMQDAIRELASDGHFTDVTIEVDSYRMRCHRMILAASSSYFRAMFCNNYRERDQESVKIEGVSADMMKILIRYAYTSYLEISCDSVQSVLEAASLLQFTRVMEACSNYFAGELAIENAPGVMELAQRHNLKHLLVLARLKCVTCFEDLREKSDYLTLSASLLESLVSRNDLLVGREEEVFRVIMDWCQYDIDQRKRHLPQLLRHVKLPLIDKIYFTREIETHPLLRHNPEIYDQLMETRLFHVSSVRPAGGKLVPRHNSNMHQVFVTVGGCNKNDSFVNDVTMLDFQHKTRATLCQLPNTDNSTRKNRTEADGSEKKAKWAEFGCVAWQGNIVISGGKETKKEVWMLITSLRQWVELGNLNTGRWRHRMAVCCGAMYAVGGYDGFLRVDSLEKYDKRENRWHEKKSMREGVSSAAVCECRERIYVIGGGPSVKISTEKVQVYNPFNDSWTLTTSMPEPAKCISAVSLESIIYVAGGTLCHVLTFDTRNKVWNTIGDALACERASCGMTICNDLIFVIGGRDDEGKAISNVSYLDPKTKTLRSECNLAFGVSHHGCITLQKFDHMRVKNN